jgi:hypothetical protein
MNIFYLSHDPVQCAQWHVDKHCVKMILESAQLLSTAHRVIDGTPTIEKRLIAGSSPARWRNIKRWSLPNDLRFPSDRDATVYQATHMNHPSAVWSRENNENYSWLFNLFTCLMDEYSYRYEKEHVCRKLVPYLQYPPANIPVNKFTQPTPAMPDEYKVNGDSIASYHNYYRGAKARMAAWKKRDVPSWFTK